MKKVLFGIFAHPDDEAFGPAGTLLKLKSEGYDIHLILLTDGEAGTNPDEVADLGATRLEEWRGAGAILGTNSAHTLHYPDGGLQTVPTDELDEKIAAIIAAVLMDYDQSIELSLMSFEPQGLTGHLDHIVASSLTDRMARKFQATAVWYFCLDNSQAPLEGTAYYEPRAREESYITTKIDVSEWLEEKQKMMAAHVSQRNDAEAMRALGIITESFRIETNSGPES